MKGLRASLEMVDEEQVLVPNVIRRALLPVVSLTFHCVLVPVWLETKREENR